MAKPFRNVEPTPFAPISIEPFQHGRPQYPVNNYNVFAREGYGNNEIVYACIEELSTSAAEPGLMVRRGKNWTHEHPLIDLLNRPNPFMDRFEFWATVILHRSIAGNAYALLIRSRSGKVVEMWLMRPDRVRVVPSSSTYIGSYEYDTGTGNPVRLAVEDVIHFKTRNPLDQFYGMPPMMPIAGRIDIDNYMRDFVSTYFQKGGVPSGVLSVKQALSEEQKAEIKKRYSREFGGAGGWHSLMVLDSAEATFTPMTRDLGASGLVIPSLDEINESRIAMAFGVPLTIIGARLGVNSSSYANKRSDRESFWDEHLAPLYKEMAGPLNLRLVPNFPGVDEIAFDLSDVRALQEDKDQIHARARADYTSGGISLEEFRMVTGYGPLPSAGTFLIPGNLAATPVARIGVILEPAPVLIAPVPQEESVE